MTNGRKSAFEGLPIPIPKGLSPEAQGCEERATLGQRTRMTKPQRVFGSGECAPQVATPLGLLFCPPFTQDSSFLATLGFMVPRYFRWNRKSDLKDRGSDGESNKAFPLTPPSPPGRGRTCERFVNVRGMSTSIPRLEARRQSGPTNNSTTERPGALSPSRRAEWFSLSLRERVGVRGKELPYRLRHSFQPLAPALIPPKIARNRLYCGIPLGFKERHSSKT